MYLPDQTPSPARLTTQETHNHNAPIVRLAKGLPSSPDIRYTPAPQYDLVPDHIHLRIEEESFMGKSLTKSQIAEHMATKTGLTKKAATQLLEDFAALAYKEAKNIFTIPGIGKLVLANRKARMGRNPQTGAEIKIPAKRVLKFRVAKAAKDAILGKK